MTIPTKITNASDENTAITIISGLVNFYYNYIFVIFAAIDWPKHVKFLKTTPNELILDYDSNP